jgi:hypothetical protein
MWKKGKGKSFHERGNFLSRDHTVISREVLRNGDDE